MAQARRRLPKLMDAPYCSTRLRSAQLISSHNFSSFERRTPTSGVRAVLLQCTLLPRMENQRPCVCYLHMGLDRNFEITTAQHPLNTRFVVCQAVAYLERAMLTATLCCYASLFGEVMMIYQAVYCCWAGHNILGSDVPLQPASTAHSTCSSTAQTIY
mmetsp:Transcript_38592/g.95923  ORF Transcript_38592/g.95923 Transcript_38592/m.95923 type:complete len:158 (+) Transcript_38592:495-968(+)